MIHELEGERVLLPREELHHLVRVRRLRDGDFFEALNVDEGTVYRCKLSKAAGSWHGLVIDILEAEPEPAIRITLAQALIKRDKFEWMIQKATELGATEIIPIITHRTEIRLDEKREQRKLQRWAKILAEAVKQCGRTRIPPLLPPISLAVLLDERTEQVKIILDEASEVPLARVLKSIGPIKDCMLVVGPEGGWDQRDRDLFVGKQLHLARLGPRILRTETASLAALAVVQYECGDFSFK